MTDLYESLCREFEVDPRSAWGAICGQFLARGMADANARIVELEALHMAIAEHNEGCNSACNARRAAGKTSCPMLGYSRDCHDCPRDWLIETDAIRSLKERSKEQ